MEEKQEYEAMYELACRADMSLKSRRETVYKLKKYDMVLDFLVKNSFKTEDKNHVIISLLLEEFLKKDAKQIKLYLDYFLQHLINITNESSKRILSGICLLILKGKSIQLNKSQKKILVDISLEWLINNSKVATECSAMEIVMHLRKEYPNEFKMVTEIAAQNYYNRTIAYQTKTKKIMNVLKSQ